MSSTAWRFTGRGNRGQLRKLAEPTVLPSGKRIPGLKLDHPRQLAVMHALVRFSKTGTNIVDAKAIHLRDAGTRRDARRRHTSRDQNVPDLHGRRLREGNLTRHHVVEFHLETELRRQI